MRSKRQSSRNSHPEFFLQLSSPPPSSAKVLEVVAEVLFFAETEWDSKLPPAAVSVAIFCVLGVAKE
jgi:hypothetical protein